MLYKFKSKATGDVIMLEPQGKQILKIIGKEPGPKGIIEWGAMPLAIDALRAAVQHEEAAQAEAKAEAAQKGEAPPRFEGIGLRQRVVPFIDMLQRAHAQEADVVWGV